MTLHLEENMKVGCYYLLKRLFDLIFAIVFTILSIPLVLLVALLIKIESPGPVIFKQKRIGSEKEPFVMYKFRTMVENAESLKTRYEHMSEGPFPAFKIRKDPRLTRVGKVLQKIHLDELPQLINVIMGDMSFIGFRPPLQDEVDNYKKVYMKRFDGVPGITSAWAINGMHKHTFDAWMKSDIWYNDNMSLLVDLKIIVGTVMLILKRLLKWK